MKAHTSQNFKTFHNCHELHRQQRYTHDITFYYRFAKLASLQKCTAQKPPKLPSDAHRKWLWLFICMLVYLFAGKTADKKRASPLYWSIETKSYRAIHWLMSNTRVHARSFKRQIWRMVQRAFSPRMYKNFEYDSFPFKLQVTSTRAPKMAHCC